MPPEQEKEPGEAAAAAIHLAGLRRDYGERTALDGVGQLGGLMITGQGLFLPTQEHTRARTSWQPLRGYGVEMQPTFDAGKNTVGFGVLGVF